LDYEVNLTALALKKISKLPFIEVYGTQCIQKKIPVISLNLSSLSSSEVAGILDKKYNICVRPGLQCAQLIHKTLGTINRGTVRVSLGYKNNLQEINSLLLALEEIYLSSKIGGLT